MHQSDGLSGRLPITALSPGVGSTPQVPVQQVSGAGMVRGLSSRALPSGLRCGGRMMLAASLGLRCGLAVRGPVSTARASFATKPSTVPKPGFAPGAPPPPGQPARPPAGTPAATTPAAPAAASPAPQGARRGPVPPPASGAGGPEGPSKLFPDPAPGAGRKSRWAALGWLIPLVGLPGMAAIYYYKLEFDKEWDNKLAEYVEEVKGLRQRAQEKQQPAPKPQEPPQAPVSAQAPKPAAPPPPPSPPAPAPTPAPAPAPKPAPPPAPVAPPPPPPPPAPKESKAPAAAPPPPPPPPAPEAGEDTLAAAVILVATEEAALEAAAAAASQPAPPSAPAPAPAKAPEVTASPPPPPPAPAAKEPAVVEEAPKDQPKEPATTPAPVPAPPAPRPPAGPGDAAAAEAATLVMLQTEAMPSAPLPEGLPEGKMGLEGHDLSPLGMVRNAVTSAGGNVADWSQWPERYAQAVADSRLAFEALTAAAKHHEERLVELRSQLVEEKARSARLEEAGEGQLARFKEVMRRYTESTRELLELEVRQAERRTRLECEQARLAEIKQRGEALEQIRLALAALSLAHEARVRQAAASQGGHAVAAGAAAVAAAAESGAPLRGAAAALAGVGRQDPLVGAVVAALPEGSVATRAELLAHFRRLRRDVAALTYLPGQKAGMVAVAMARLAASIKADESNTVKVLGPEAGPGGVDAALARTEALLAGGQLAAAADELAAAVGGTAAAVLAADWVEAARRRAAAEAGVAALNAHAAATWAAVA